MNSEIRNSKFETNSNSQCSHGRNFARSRFEHSDFGFLDQKSSPHAGRIARSRSSIRQDSGFTLVELMVVVMIISILATYITVAMYGAMERARITRTQTQIRKIETVIATMYHDYQSRRVPISTAGAGPLLAAKARLDGLRELMRMEMPDRIFDVDDPPATGIQRPARSRAYKRAMDNNPQGPNAWSHTFQGAECLYLIMATHTDGNRKGTDFFNESEIGDTDGDGMKEILDAWGNPIEFLRWAPGLRSLIQDGDPAHADPFDPRGVYSDLDGDGDADTYAIHPYIFSPGPDGEFDTVTDHMTDDDATRLHYSMITPKNNPYDVPEGDVSQLGTERGHQRRRCEQLHRQHQQPQDGYQAWGIGRLDTFDTELALLRK